RRDARAAAAAVNAADFVDRGLTGPAIGKAMEGARIAAITALKAGYSPR
ncbi:MAG: multifunctional CCA addition/repair protein, partial [Rhodanobacter sp.]